MMKTRKRKPGADLARMFGAQIVAGPATSKVDVSEFQLRARRLLAREVRQWRRSTLCNRWEDYNYTFLRGRSFQLKSLIYWGDEPVNTVWRRLLYLLHRVSENSFDPIYEPGVKERSLTELKDILSQAAV